MSGKAQSFLTSEANQIMRRKGASDARDGTETTADNDDDGRRDGRGGCGDRLFAPPSHTTDLVT